MNEKPQAEIPLNHLYKDIPAKPGSVAACGHVKTTAQGFDPAVATCNACVAAVVGPIKQP